jgi:hypothetical protein
VKSRWLYGKSSTFHLLPEAGGEVEGVGVVGDGELAGITSGSAEETDLVLGVEGDAVSEPREWRVPEDL